MSNSPEHAYNTVQGVVENQLCCGCGTCVSVCPVGAIKMVENPAGLLVPSIDCNKCNNCSLCVQVCPGIGLDEDVIPEAEDIFEGNIIASYCGYACDERIRQKGQSGGVVTAILLHLLETKRIDKAIVTIMPEDGTLRAKTILTDKHEDIIAACGSKYCPVAVNEILSQVNSDDRVAMVGLPCHFHGLTKLRKFNKGLDSILKIGLICEHILTFSAIDYFVNKACTQEELISLRYKNKNFGGWPGNITFNTSGGTCLPLNSSYRFDAKKHFRPYRCFFCFDKMNVMAHLVVGDAWGIDEQKGNNVIISRSDAANEVLEDILSKRTLKVKPVKAKAICSGQNIKKRKENYLANINCAKKLKLPFPEPIITELASFGKKEKKQLLYSYKMGQEEDKTRIINRATVRIMADRITRKYSPRNVIRKLLELREFAEMNYRSLLIVGGGFANKGAEAMVLTVARAARARWPDVQIYVGCDGNCCDIVRGLGLIPVKRRGSAGLFSRLKSKIKTSYMYSKCDAVIDVGGYQFGDPWGVQHAWNGYRSVKKCSFFGTPKFFMPQAWGPFSSREFCRPITGILNSAKLCFVRDHFSQHEISKMLGATPSNMFFSHDVAWNFTGNDLETGRMLLKRHGIAKKSAMLVCITPNLRVYERHEGEGVDNKYIRFLREIVLVLCRYSGLQIVLMGHALRKDGSGDRKLCRFLMQLLQESPQVIHIDAYLSADEVKAIIGNCELLISSRYHALIAALSQGIPSIAIGWSQKYNELMSEVGLPESVLTIEDDEEHISEVIDSSIVNRDKLTLSINQNVVRFKKSAHDAMTQVLDAIESKS